MLSTVKNMKLMKNYGLPQNFFMVFMPLYVDAAAARQSTQGRLSRSVETLLHTRGPEPVMKSSARRSRRGAGSNGIEGRRKTG
jgi:hypothetical protein